MKTAFKYILLLMVLVGILSSCHKEKDDYTTMAYVTMQAPDSITVVRMQGTVTLTNLSNHQTYSASSFKGTTVSLELYRGVYSILVQGSVQYKTKEGKTEISNFRASSDYSEFMEHPAQDSLEILFL